ncbi:Oligosaccharide translocation protein rft1 [Phytophthora boehmeriae]|uniref:Man(5)GlcNAc(2)-PP-dolichol translocation protein RFT1 n=1 Tax=Phytophthora boehmeriae TaxID=109152 RepID=A0A8T1X7V5_9STRA|nr:Oligosaccharide translocation protein rft1 [Phytophthora boehmeriae]
MSTATGVLSRAVRGGSYRFLQRLLTFAANSFVLRKLHLSVTGAVTVRLELALASIFLLRDGFRLAFLRMPSLDSSSQAEKKQLQQLVNVAWLSTAISWAVAMLLLGYSAVSGSNETDDVLKEYPTALAMYCGAAMVEALAEPMFVLAHASVLVGWQVAAQSAAFLVRAAVQYVGVVIFDFGLISYGIAELAYATMLLAMFAWFFWRRIHGFSAEKGTFALTRMSQLLPGRVEEGDDWCHKELVALLVPLSVQSGVKYLLAEGDKWVLTGFASLQNMGVYGLVSNLGSLMPRIVFLPIEEATKTIFSKLALAQKQTSADTKEAENKERSLTDGKMLLMILLKLMNMIGFLFVCFGTNYAYTLVLLLYGAEKARQGVGAALAVYCVYIPFLGVNGVCEAVVHAIGDDHQLMRLNKLLGVFFVIYALSALVFMQVLNWGTLGLIMANCVNMGCRIIYCLTFLASYFGQEACVYVRELAQRVHDSILDKLVSLQQSLEKLQKQRENSGVLPATTLETLFQTRLVVEAKRKVQPGQIADNVRDGQDDDNPPQAPLFVQFPKYTGENNEAKPEKDDAQQAINFRSRPVTSSAVEDISSIATKREPREQRFRYIMSSRLGAVPPTKSILDEYPIPKDVLDALERHRHFHVDDSSPLTAFESIRLPPPAPTEPIENAPPNPGANGDWECFYRRSVPLERPPVSFVLASLAVAPVRPLPVSNDLFHQQTLAAATADDALLLHEVRQLYDHTHDSHRDFRTELHRHLDLQYLVDLSFRSSLTSASYFVDDEVDSEQYGGANAEPTVQIPTHLCRQRIDNGEGDGPGTSSKWKFLLNGVQHMANRRGAISDFNKNDAAVRAQRNDLLDQLCTLTPQDMEFLTMWYGHNPEAEAEAIASAGCDSEEGGGARLDPVPMSPQWSVRFELVWKQLALSTTERLDLAIKYSSLGYSTRLPDAVTLWETAGALITEHEDLLRLVRSIVSGPPRPAATGLTQDTAMLQALLASAAHVREILRLTYVEVGDYVTFQGNFYLAKMERDTPEIRRMMEEGVNSKANQLQSATTTT